MPELKEPLRGKLVVKAFSRVKPSERPTGKLEIPFVLCPARVAVDVTFSPELPAQPGQEITARIKLRQEATGDPLANMPVQFVWDKVSQAKPLGSILTEGARTDGEGFVELRYAAPAELSYRPKERYYDEVKLMLGEGKKAVPLEKTVVIPVAPAITLSCLAEKKGLQQDYPWRYGPDWRISAAISAATRRTQNRCDFRPAQPRKKPADRPFEPAS